jgi:RNA polymerase sigma factor (sigma-70 family)
VRTKRRSGEEKTDSELADAVRGGNHEAFSELYRRHRVTAYRFARVLLCSEQGVDDLVAEAFAKVFQRLISGGGPNTAFRSYVMTTLRTTLYKQIMADRLLDRRTEVPEALATGHIDPVLAKFESDVTMQAFNSLPQRWRLVLTYLEIEGLTTANVAELLGIQANAVSALAFRAREALRLAYLQMHVGTTVTGECRETTAHVASWLCGRLSRVKRSRVQQHIDNCDRCAGAAEEIMDLLVQMQRSTRLALVRPTGIDTDSGQQDTPTSWLAEDCDYTEQMCPAPRVPVSSAVRT